MGWLISGLLSPIVAGPQPLTMETLLNPLKDGEYRLCTESAPQDWHDGSSICLSLLK